MSDGILNTLSAWEQSFINSAKDIENSVLNGTKSQAEAILTDIRGKFNTVYTGLQATAAIIATCNTKLSSLTASVSKINDSAVTSKYNKLLADQKRIQNNQTMFTNYINEIIAKYKDIILGEAEKTTSMGLAQIIIGGIAIAAIAAIAALIYGLYKAFLTHKAEVNAQNNATNSFATITAGLENGSLTQTAATSLLNHLPGGANIGSTIQSMIPAVVIAGVVVVAIMFLNRNMK